ncbi:M9 family metallopeptidase [Streptacidiphilus jiangxiensis]|uniref:microbial collagenase n=1 Tax=Streptacidiphilus jiangxiensis TaxID=235985 RepID=A0A1H7R332_STRJI|nr:M9 family metallopeptidase [Streptacidiphilus jiangxiensis]SEL53977.1 microbial collagenase [Streptacidiphilus jiangxiensis]
MRQSLRLPRFLAGVAAASTALVGLLATPSLAAPATRPAPRPKPTHAVSRLLPPSGTATLGTSSQSAVQDHRLPAALLPPHSPLTAPRSKPHTHAALAHAAATAASCTPADFSGRTGAALVSFVESAGQDCLNTLFPLTGPTAAAVFSENQMLTIANGLKSVAAGYTGDDSGGAYELGYFLQAGYYVQWYDGTDVGSYDATLTGAVASALDTFVASPHFLDVSDGNGQVAGEMMILSDSANLQARYLGTYARVLNAYTSAYNSSWYMTNFVNSVFTPLFRGHQNPDYVAAVTADPSIITTLDTFALNHTGLLGTAQSFLDANAGLEASRFIEHAALQATVRPLIKGLLDASSITGPTAPLWVGVAGMAAYYDQGNCAYYGVCNLPQQLTAAALPISHTCDATHTIRAQSLTAADLAAVCTSLEHQDAFVHGLVKDNGPIPGQYESSLQMVVFASQQDYQTYAGGIYGVSTNNGGITLVGNPTDPTNQPLSLTYQWPTDNGFTARIWNLNHEYTHALDGRYDMKGTFSQQIAVPDVWWIEGVAEYVSYTYRGVTDTWALGEAPKHTYALSTLFQNTYTNSDQTRTYAWGYLAVRYMVERHPDVVAAMLAHFRTGDYTGGYAVYNSIGTAYDADFDSWLGSLATGASPCTSTNPQEMGQNCYRAVQPETQGNVAYYWLWLPAGTSTLTVSTSGGTGTAYLLYDPDTWAAPGTYTQGSFDNGTTQTLTVSNTQAGYRYISLYAQTDFSGATLTTRY